MTDWSPLLRGHSAIEIVENNGRALRVKVATSRLGDLFDDFLHDVLLVDYCWVHFPEDNWVFVFEDPSKLTRSRVLGGIERLRAGALSAPVP